MCFFSLNESYAINSVIFSLSLMALSFVDDYVDDVEPVPDNSALSSAGHILCLIFSSIIYAADSLYP